MAKAGTLYKQKKMEIFSFHLAYFLQNLQIFYFDLIKHFQKTFFNTQNIAIIGLANFRKTINYFEKCFPNQMSVEKTYYFVYHTQFET
jgi:hypothetical protein